MSAVLVTGGAGFIGSHVAEAYLSSGYEVTILDDLSKGRRDNVPAGARFVQAEVNSAAARDLLASGGFTVLNHHAAQADVRVSVADPGLDARTNVLGLINLLEGARTGGVRRVVFASSGGVVYDEHGPLPHREDAVKLPVSPYGVSKLTSEYYLGAYGRLYDLEVVALRYSNVYGPRQDPHGEAGVVAIFGNRIRRGEALTVFGDGEQTRDYVYVGDVARANLAATIWQVVPITDVNSCAFNIGTGTETTVNALAQTMMRAASVDLPVQYAPARLGELRRSVLNVEKAMRELRWRPATALEAGLERTWTWIREGDP